jgi:hypothetical protein
MKTGPGVTAYGSGVRARSHAISLSAVPGLIADKNCLSPVKLKVYDATFVSPYIGTHAGGMLPHNFHLPDPQSWPARSCQSGLLSQAAMQGMCRSSS